MRSVIRRFRVIKQYIGAFIEIESVIWNFQNNSDTARNSHPRGDSHLWLVVGEGPKDHVVVLYDIAFSTINPTGRTYENE